MEDLTALRMRLSPGERLLWMGQPQRGLRLSSSDLFVVPFSLLWCGFALFWEKNVLDSNAPLVFRLWGIPFVLVGLHFVVGRFFWDAWRRSRTRYAVTDQRVIILSGGWRPQLKTVPLRSLPELSLTEEDHGRGTIAFGSATLPFGRFGWSGWPGMSEPMVPSFERIENVHAVHELIRNAHLLAA